MSDSILESTKKVLGIDVDDDSFDVDIVMHINTVFSDLLQLGIGPDVGYMIEGAEEKWDDFLDEAQMARFNAVKSYIYLRVRLLFDPPVTSFMIDSMSKQIEKMEWRLSIHREGLVWVPPALLEQE